MGEEVFEGEMHFFEGESLNGDWEQNLLYHELLSFLR